MPNYRSLRQIFHWIRAVLADACLRGNFTTGRHSRGPLPAQREGQSRSMKTLAFGFAIILAIFAWHYANRPITYPPGILIASDPKQTSITEAPITCGDFTLQPLAHLALDARLLHLKIYRYDKQAALVPIDLALGWGPMSDQRVLDQITVTQSMRFYWFDYKQPPISKEEIIAHSTNMHIIPS